MATSYSFNDSDLLSHPDKLLIEHLSDVAKISTQILKGKSFNFSLKFKNQKLEITNLSWDLMYLSGAFHDIGKATSFFQHYIRNPEKLHDQRKNHALLSSIFVYFVSLKYLEKYDFDEDLKQLLSSFLFTTVRRHHGNLGNLADEIILDDEKRQLVKEQLKAIDEQKIQDIIDKLLANFDTQISWKDFVNFVEQDKYNEILEDFSFDFLEDTLIDIEQSARITLFYLHHLFYSALLFADKNDVILKDFEHSVKPADIVGNINRYRDEKGFNNPKTEINRLKNQAFFEALSNLEKIFSPEQHIYSITMPTGIGKTITSFMLADKMRQLAKLPYARIVINIPFTSIIDQNFEVYSEIVQTDDSNVLLKHHHLSEAHYKINEEIADFDKSQFLIETWQSDIIVTTFVQFLESIFTSDKSKIMKLSQIANSIVLLDEIQTIPYKYWQLIREGFKIIGKKYNVYFILISATQPLIFTPQDDIFELVPDYKQYFKFFNRTKLIIEKDDMSFDDFKNKIVDYIIGNQQKDILVILNTKNETRKLFEFVRDNIDTHDKELYFMTTLITPYERKRIIKCIKQKSDKQKIIITTQLVEAGVDISVDTVFRQIAPLDSIIQAAGRANRYDEKDKISEVYIYKISDLQKKTNLIYGTDLILKTENVLNKYTEVQEKDYLQLIEDYFVEVRKQSDNSSCEILTAMKNFDFEKVDFKLIKNIKNESVFVQLNENAKKIWEKYVEIYSIPDTKKWERKELFSKIKTEFYDYVINIPVPYDRENIVFDSEKEYGFYVSKLDNPSKNYNYSEDDFTKNTGYNNDEVAIIL